MARELKQSIMTRQAEMVAWACEVIEPLRSFKVEDLKIKHNADAGCYDFTYNDGMGVFASGSGVPVDVQLLHAGSVERYLFAKDCEELLSRNVRDLLSFDYGMVQSLLHALKMKSDGKILLLGEGVTFELLMDFVGDNCGLYYDLSNLKMGVYAVSRFEDAKQRVKQFMDSLVIKVRSVHH